MARPLTLNPLTVKLTRQEANVVLRALATHSDREATAQLDRDTCRWLAERLLGVLLRDRAQS